MEHNKENIDFRKGHKLVSSLRSHRFGEHRNIFLHIEVYSKNKQYWVWEEFTPEEFEQDLMIDYWIDDAIELFETTLTKERR